MKKSISIVLMIVISVAFIRCQKEKIFEGAPIELSYILSHVSEYGAGDGEIDLSVSGGVPPYGFFWSNGKTSEDIDSLVAGNYVIVVTDKQHQIKADTIEILQPDPDSIVVKYEINYPSTNDGVDGSIDLTLSGGYPPYTFLWSNGAETEDISGLGADIYTITITDSYGLTVTHTISLLDFIIDVEGNSYGTVTIGNQTWMKQNLRVTHTAQGEEIENFVYREISSYAGTYGRLYTWDVVMNGSRDEGAQGICPDGWHVPTDAEMKILETELGMTSDEADMGNTWRGAGIGTKLKFGGSSGFDALLSGRRLDDGTYNYLDKIEYLWTSTESGENKVWRRTLDKQENKVGRFDSTPKNYAFSVRCLKNDD